MYYPTVFRMVVAESVRSLPPLSLLLLRVFEIIASVCSGMVSKLSVATNGDDHIDDEEEEEEEEDEEEEVRWTLMDVKYSTTAK